MEAPRLLSRACGQRPPRVSAHGRQSVLSGVSRQGCDQTSSPPDAARRWRSPCPVVSQAALSLVWPARCRGRVSKFLPRVTDQGGSQEKPNPRPRWETPNPCTAPVIRRGPVPSAGPGVSQSRDLIYFHVGTVVFGEEEERNVCLTPRLSDGRKERGSCCSGRLRGPAPSSVPACPGIALGPGDRAACGQAHRGCPLHPAQGTFHPGSFLSNFPFRLPTKSGGGQGAPPGNPVATSSHGAHGCGGTTHRFPSLRGVAHPQRFPLLVWRGLCPPGVTGGGLWCGVLV